MNHGFLLNSAGLVILVRFERRAGNIVAAEAYFLVLHASKGGAEGSISTRVRATHSLRLPVERGGGGGGGEGRKGGKVKGGGAETTRSQKVVLGLGNLASATVVALLHPFDSQTCGQCRQLNTMIT